MSHTENAKYYVIRSYVLYSENKQAGKWNKIEITVGL